MERTWSATDAKCATEAASEPVIIREQLEKIEARRRERAAYIERQIEALQSELHELNQLGGSALSAHAMNQPALGPMADRYRGNTG